MFKVLNSAIAGTIIFDSLADIRAPISSILGIVSASLPGLIWLQLIKMFEYSPDTRYTQDA